MQPFTPADSAVAPIVDRYVPAGQFAGVAVPTTQYLPTGQGRHAEAATPLVKELYVPAAQSISKPSGQYLPARQLEQLAASVAPAALYVPGAHLICAADAKGQYEPAGQSVQDAAVAASVPRNLPASQSMGAAIPASGQRVPDGQGMQSVGAIARIVLLYVPFEHFVALWDPRLEYDP
jgi:hypothetical protein